MLGNAGMQTNAGPGMSGSPTLILDPVEFDISKSKFANAGPCISERLSCKSDANQRRARHFSEPHILILMIWMCQKLRTHKNAGPGISESRTLGLDPVVEPAVSISGCANKRRGAPSSV